MAFQWFNLYKNIQYLFPWLFFETFSEVLDTDDDLDWKGRCLVQRIEPVRLSRSGGKRVKLTLRASSASDAWIDRIYVSQPDPGGSKYDSAAADITRFFDAANFTIDRLGMEPVTNLSLVIHKGQTVTVPFPTARHSGVEYNLDDGQPLLIAVDFNADHPSRIRCKKAVPTDQACAYRKSGAADASKPNRSNFSQYPGIYLIEKIEISTGLADLWLLPTGWWKS